MSSIFTPPDLTDPRSPVQPESIMHAYNLTTNEWGNLSKILGIKNGELEKPFADQLLYRKQRMLAACNAAEAQPEDFKVSGQNPFDTLFALAALYRRGVSKESMQAHCTELQLDGSKVIQVLDLYEGINIQHCEQTVCPEKFPPRTLNSILIESSVDFYLSNIPVTKDIYGSSWIHNTNAFETHIEGVLQYLTAKRSYVETFETEEAARGTLGQGSIPTIGGVFATLEGSRENLSEFFARVGANMKNQIFMFLLLTEEFDEPLLERAQAGFREANGVEVYVAQKYVNNGQFKPFLETVVPTFEEWLSNESVSVRKGGELHSTAVRDHAAFEFVLDSLAQPTSPDRLPLFHATSADLPNASPLHLDSQMNEVLTDFVIGMTTRALMTIDNKTPLGNLKNQLASLPLMMRAARQNRPYINACSQIQFQTPIPGLGKVILLDVRKPTPEQWISDETYNQIIEASRYLYEVIRRGEPIVVCGINRNGAILPERTRTTLTDSLRITANKNGSGGKALPIRSLTQALQAYSNSGLRGYQSINRVLDCKTYLI